MSLIFHILVGSKEIKCIIISDLDVVKVPKDCQDVYDRGSRTSGVHTISPDGVTKMNVYCEQQLDGGGWTVRC